MDWSSAREPLRGPIFAPLAGALARLPAARWPTHGELSAAADGIRTATGQPLRFVAPRRQGDGEERAYEARIAQSGEVETRPRNWHDLFNALAWIAYPRSKARLNAQHAAMLQAGGAGESRRRSPQRDALTLFDEGGVIVLATDPAFFALIVDFRWKALFWERRADLADNVRFLAFGHALFEKALDPYLGIVAKTVFLEVGAALLAQPLPALLEATDARLARHLEVAAHFASPRALAPLPVLGIPGWHPANGSEAFYDDSDHFRSRRRSG